MDSKSIGLQGPCGFDSHPRHHAPRASLGCMAAPAFPFSWKTCPAWFRAGVIELREPTRGGGNVSGWGHSGDIVYTRLRLVARSLEGGRRMGRKKPLRFDLKAFLERAGDGRTIPEPQEKQTHSSQRDPADAALNIPTRKAK